MPETAMKPTAAEMARAFRAAPMEHAAAAPQETRALTCARCGSSPTSWGPAALENSHCDSRRLGPACAGDNGLDWPHRALARHIVSQSAGMD